MGGKGAWTPFLRTAKRELIRDTVHTKKWKVPHESVIIACLLQHLRGLNELIADFHDKHHRLGNHVYTAI